MREVRLIRLGTTHHEVVDEQMRELQQQRIDDEIPDTLILVEHPEVVTIGPKARNDGIEPPPDYPSRAVDRGGGLTWHGPGQLVIYPVFKWDLEGEVNTKAIIHALEGWVIESFAALGIESARDARMMGVWVDGHKVCSIGISLLRWVSRHGLSINYDTPRGRVERLQGCGLDAGMTSSLAALGYSISRERLEESLLNSNSLLNLHFH